MRQSLIDLVWARAGHCCEYCRMPQEFDELPFEIDHIIATQHRGLTVPSNLALVCFADNHHKGPNLAGIDPKTGKRAWLFHVATSGNGISAGRGPSSSAVLPSGG